MAFAIINLHHLSPKPIFVQTRSPMEQLKDFLEDRYHYYNQHFDIPADPISIPKQFSQKQDIEISAFFAATIAWGNRTSIIKSARYLMELMEYAPYDFIRNHTEQDLQNISQFYYRTFNATDLLYFIAFFKWHYSHHESLEAAFTLHQNSSAHFDIKQSLTHFYTYFFSQIELPFRTQKHIGNVQKNAACKRLNMFLRWMVRKDNIDFGLWQHIPTTALVCPLDVHVSTVARSMGLISRKQDNWLTATELTEQLRLFDVQDPVKYDLVLFSLGIERKQKKLP